MFVCIQEKIISENARREKKGAICNPFLCCAFLLRIVFGEVPILHVSWRHKWGTVFLLKKHAFFAEAFSVFNQHYAYSFLDTLEIVAKTDLLPLVK